MPFHEIEGQTFCYDCGREARIRELFTSVEYACDYCEANAREVEAEETTKPLFDYWWKGLAFEITPTLRDAIRAALAVQDTSGSSRIHSTPTAQWKFDPATARVNDLLDPESGVTLKHTLPPPESALPETSSTPSRQCCLAGIAAARRIYPGSIAHRCWCGKQWNIT